MFRALLMASFPLLCVLLATHECRADREFVASLEQVQIPGLFRSAVGVTRRNTPILSLVSEADLDLRTPKTRILLIGGLDGSRDSVTAVLEALRWFYTDPAAKTWQEMVAISAVPCANPDGLAEGTGEANASGGRPSRGYPPQGTAYGDPYDPESSYLWRWIGMHAPDLVVDVRWGAALRWFVPPALDAGFQPRIAGVPEDSLVRQSPRVAPCETGTIPAMQVEAAGGFLTELLDGLQKSSFRGPSAARLELQRRLDRTPLELARQLAEHYGNDLNQVVYIPAVALIGRIRLGQLAGDPQHLRDVEQIVSPYYRGDKSAAPSSGSGLSGQLVFCELAEHAQGERRQRYLQLARAAADLAFDTGGRPLEAMPFHLEMSDSVFMGGPILARVGRLAGEPRYYEACVRHIRFMQQLVLRDDGLYRHSPLDEAAWGRGNGFPALGLAMCLSDLPEDHPQRAYLLSAFQSHLGTLARHQDATGMWHQVIDRPESYRELSCTCMITFALACGVRRGWLEREQYQPVIDKAWYAIRTRVPPDGRLVDVCTGTGKQARLRDYYDRQAILGPDARGGAMALLVATELARPE